MRNVCLRLWRHVEPSPPPTALRTRTENPRRVRLSAKTWASTTPFRGCSSTAEETTFANCRVSKKERCSKQSISLLDLKHLPHLADFWGRRFKERNKLLHNHVDVDLLRGMHSSLTHLHLQFADQGRRKSWTRGGNETREVQSVGYPPRIYLTSDCFLCLPLGTNLAHLHVKDQARDLGQAAPWARAMGLGRC